MLSVIYGYYKKNPSNEHTRKVII